MRIDLRPTETRQALGLLPGTVPEQSQRLQEKRPRYETCRAICDALAAADRPLSRLEICRAIGRKKTPHLRQLIDEMAQHGILQRAMVQHWNTELHYVYELREW